MKKCIKWNKISFFLFFLFPTFSTFGLSDRSFFREQQNNPQEFPTSLSDDKKRELESFATELTLLEKLYLKPSIVSSNLLIEKALKGMASDLDPYTIYMPPELFSKFNTDFTSDSKEENIKFQQIQKNYAYIKLSFFQKNTSFQMYKKIKDFEDENQGKLKGMILDLRDNPGGLLDEAIKVSSLFLENQMIVSIEGRDQQIEKVRSLSGKNALNDFPMIVLVNKGTASSSEIVAGALQDSGRAIIMGSETYGKSTIQDVIPLPNGGAIKITTAKYHIPNTKGLQKNAAILPDIPFDFSRDQGLSADQEIQIAYDHLIEKNY